MIYMEPEKQVLSRSADECVVALCDQWSVQKTLSDRFNILFYLWRHDNIRYCLVVYSLPLQSNHALSLWSLGVLVLFCHSDLPWGVPDRFDLSGSDWALYLSGIWIMAMRNGRNKPWASWRLWRRKSHTLCHWEIVVEIVKLLCGTVIGGEVCECVNTCSPGSVTKPGRTLKQHWIGFRSMLVPEPMGWVRPAYLCH